MVEDMQAVTESRAIRGRKIVDSPSWLYKGAVAKRFCNHCACRWNSSWLSVMIVRMIDVFEAPGTRLPWP